jgi:hypothetical protein
MGPEPRIFEMVRRAQDCVLRLKKSIVGIGFVELAEKIGSGVEAGDDLAQLVLLYNFTCQR